ncbi:MAG: hypothetical protein ABIH23_01885 [bacterium]
MEVLIFAAVALFIIALVLIGYLGSRARIKELSAWADSKGFRFNPDRDHDMEDRYPDFSCLREGSARYAYNTIQGSQNGRGICAFDYHYETYSHDSKGHRQTHHHHFSAVIANTHLPLKPLFIRKEGFFDKITEFFGMDDIDFESAEFSRNFYVKSPDKRWAYDVISQATMEFLMSAPTFSLQFQGNDIIAYRGSTFSVSDFEDAVNVIEGILNRLPDYLLRELKGQN